MKKEKFNQIFIFSLLGLGVVLFVLGSLLKNDLVLYAGIGLISGGFTISILEFFRLEVLKEK